MAPVFGLPVHRALAAAVGITGVLGFGQVPVNPGNGLAALDGLGRAVPAAVPLRPSAGPRYVALFYWTWHEHFAERFAPRNNSEILRRWPEAAGDPGHAGWGPFHAPHFWGEPLFGFYRNSDPWVLRRHARLLADAGVDVIVFDCTNGSFTWKEAYLPLLEAFTQARRAGIAAPHVAFLLAFGPSEGAGAALEDIYDTLYRPGRYRDLWFLWRGKPLVMAYPESLRHSKRSAEEREAIRSFFTFRPGQPKYRGGPERGDQWGWLEVHPQNGYARQPGGSFEEVPVGVSQNWADPQGLVAMNFPNARGRSFSAGGPAGSTPDGLRRGANFQEQWDRAIALDPELVFVTGWNEWVAGRHPEWQGLTNAFPDQYDPEHSRDIEPARGTLEDHYYYQFVANVRRFKGSVARPLEGTRHTARMDGEFEDWSNVPGAAPDPVEPPSGRDHPGYQGMRYVSPPVRNDMVLVQVCDDADHVYFRVATAGALSPSSGPDWMRLLVDADGEGRTGWNGFEWAVQWREGRAWLVRPGASGEVRWDQPIAGGVGERGVEVAVPKRALGREGRTQCGFKWMDDFPLTRPYSEALAVGESAPWGRFWHTYQLAVRGGGATAAAPGQRSQTVPGLTLGPGGVVLRGGTPYRGVGVNYFDCFLRALLSAGDTSYDDGFRTLAAHGIPFARFCATGFWPREMRLYQTNRAEYFRRLDGVVRSAEAHGIGLVPSLFWQHACVPDLVGEPVDQWGNVESRTLAFLREYVEAVVTRYRASPAIWAWEFGNEMNLAADLPNAAQHRPPVWPTLGTATTRTARDELTHDHLVTALREFGREVRRHDPHRLITSGNAMPRPAAWHNRRERTWTKDSPEQSAEMLALTTPDPVNLVSVHCYEEDLGRLEAAAAAAANLGKPLFVGEFQVPRPDSLEARGAFTRFLGTLERLRVPLAAVWVFDFPAQEKDYSVTATNARAWQLPALGAWNGRR